MTRRTTTATSTRPRTPNSFTTVSTRPSNMTFRTKSAFLRHSIVSRRASRKSSRCPIGRLSDFGVFSSKAKGVSPTEPEGESSRRAQMQKPHRSKPSTQHSSDPPKTMLEKMAGDRLTGRFFLPIQPHREAHRPGLDGPGSQSGASCGVLPGVRTVDHRVVRAGECECRVQVGELHLVEHVVRLELQLDAAILAPGQRDRKAP